MTICLTQQLIFILHMAEAQSRESFYSITSARQKIILYSNQSYYAVITPVNEWRMKNLLPSAIGNNCFCIWQFGPQKKRSSQQRPSRMVWKQLSAWKNLANSPLFPKSFKKATTGFNFFGGTWTDINNCVRTSHFCKKKKWYDNTEEIKVVSVQLV